MSSPLPAETTPLHVDAAIVGAGPAGLMAAESLLRHRPGTRVAVFDAMPSAGRKFLLAGKGGLNLTHSEPHATFVQRYGTRSATLQPLLDAFGSQAVRDWAAQRGVETFVGTSGRVFPTDMKAAPLLRAWLHDLRGQGVQFCMRHRWLGALDPAQLAFATPAGQREVCARALVLALGGGSWARLGSDGAWVAPLAARGVPIAPLRPANCGFDVRSPRAAQSGWSPHFAERFAGQPLKSVAVRFAPEGAAPFARRGEFVATATGVEGSLVYAMSDRLRDTIEREGRATFELDLLPDWTAERVREAVQHPRGARSLSSHLKSRLGIDGIKMALLHEQLPAEALSRPEALSAALKSLPITVVAPRPLDEAISTAGGVQWEALDERLMLTSHPGAFVAGEMLDWEAPTGGYLLTACLATGAQAGAGAAHRLGTADAS